MDIKQFSLQLNIKSVISNYIQVKSQGSRCYALCPFHPDKNPSLFIHEDKNFFYCFGCGSAGDSISFVMKFRSFDFKQALEEICLYFDIPLTVKKSDKLDLYIDAVKQSQIIYIKKQDIAIEYLKKRNISKKTIIDLGIGFDSGLLPNFDKNILSTLGLTNNKGESFFQGRITFPIYDLKNQIRGFSCRTINDNQSPKYLNSLNSPIYNKSHILYGMNYVDKNSDIIVVEGCMDHISLYEQGFTNCVAILGSRLSSFHINILSKCKAKVFLMLDGDQAGHSGMLSAISQFIKFNTDVRICLLPKDQDPSDIAKKGLVQKYLDSSLDLESLILKIASMKDAYKALFKLKDIILSQVNSFRKIDIINKLSNKLNFSVNDLYKMSSVYYKNKDENQIKTELEKAIFCILYNPELCNTDIWKKSFQEECNFDKQFAMLRLLVLEHDSTCTSNYLFSLLHSNFSKYDTNIFCFMCEEINLWVMDFELIMQRLVKQKNKLLYIYNIFYKHVKKDK